MSDIATKLMTVAENQQKVYEAGAKSEYDRFWDEFQQNGDRRRYQHAFANEGWNKNTLKPKYPIKVGSTSTFGQAMFQNCNMISNELLDMTEISKLLDLTECTNANSMFSNAKIKNITVDLSNVTSMTNCFNQNNGNPMHNIYLKVSEKCTNFSNAFLYSGNKFQGKGNEIIIFLEGSVIAASGLNFQRWDCLNNDSLTSIINALSPDTTGLSITLSLTAVNNAFETSEGAADGENSAEWQELIASRNNWTIFLLDA